MAGFGASDPLPSVPARVGLLNRYPTLGSGDGDYSSCPIAATGQFLEKGVLEEVDDPERALQEMG
jgi:hypothetical protein